MVNQHISCNIRLVLDLIDYSDYVESEALILFLDFYKAFNTVEHQFLSRALKIFGFGEKFISSVRMLYKDISSSVMLFPNTTKRFPVHRLVRQGCPSSPFLFLVVVELLSIHILHCHPFKGLRIFEKEIRITQLADDTVLFLKDKHQIQKAIDKIDDFSRASGLKLNKSKCKMLSLYDTEDTVMCDIPVKNVLDTSESKLVRTLKNSKKNFIPKIQKTKNIFKMWLQRDLFESPFE